MAGFFGLFDYTKPGRGISKNEPQKPRFFFFWELFFRKFWQLVQLNLLYIAFCLPIVTIGPVTAGFTYVLRNMANEQPVFLFSDFWDGIKNNIKQSCAYSVILIVCAILLNFAWRFYSANIDAALWMYVPFILCALLTLLFVFMSFYVFLMIVTLALPLSDILKNAAILAIVCLKTNLLTLLFVGLTLVLSFLLLPYSVIPMVFIIPAFCGFIICFNSYKEIKKYAIDPFIEAQTAAGEASVPETASIFEEADNTKK